MTVNRIWFEFWGWGKIHYVKYLVLRVKDRNSTVLLTKAISAHGTGKQSGMFWGKGNKNKNTAFRTDEFEHAHNIKGSRRHVALIDTPP
jgi:hypothetical protein